MLDVWPRLVDLERTRKCQLREGSRGIGTTKMISNRRLDQVPWDLEMRLSHQWQEDDRLFCDGF